MSHHLQENASTIGNVHRNIGTILVIDDEPTICDLAQEILEELNYTVETVLDGNEALRMIREDSSRFALIIVDLSLPSIDGDKLIREIHALRPDLRLIVSSGQISRIPAEELYRMGVVALMPKPYGVPELACLAASALCH
jgi:CheY-like chemotaxis protein